MKIWDQIALGGLTLLFLGSLEHIPPIKALYQESRLWMLAFAPFGLVLSAYILRWLRIIGHRTAARLKQRLQRR